MKTAFSAKFDEEFDKCETYFERIVLTCAALLGTLGNITGEPFDFENVDPKTWPKLVVTEMQRISKMTNRSPELTMWLDGAGKVLVAMHRNHGRFAPN